MNKHKHEPFDNGHYDSRCIHCGRVMSSYTVRSPLGGTRHSRVTRWRVNDGRRARILAGPVWEYPALGKLDCE